MARNIFVCASDLAVVTGHNPYKDKAEIYYKYWKKHYKDDLIYDVTSLRKDFRMSNPNGIRVRSYKLGSRRRIYTMETFTPTVFYFCCNNCSLHFTFRNQKSENMIRGKKGNY